MFEQVEAMASVPDALLIVLIDEVEGLGLARRAAINGHEPSDAIRAVNSVLTHLDRLRMKHSNVLLLSTSNLPEIVDEALIDRVDWSIKVPLPGPQVAYCILTRAIVELMRKRLLQPNILSLPSWQDVVNTNGYKATNVHTPELIGQRLKQMVLQTKKLSGRQLKKLPFMAIVECACSKMDSTTAFELEPFLDALEYLATKSFD